MKKIAFLFFSCLFSFNSVLADTLSLIHVSDIHFPSKNRMKYENRNLEQAENNLNKAILKINNSDIDYVFITGDFVDQSLKSVYDNFFKNINRLNKPYYLSIGNHDVNSPNGLNKQEALDYLKKNTPYKQTHMNYCIEINDDIIAVMLDGSDDEKINSRGYFSKKTLKWLENIIIKNSDKNILVFQHFPIVEPLSDEYFLRKHSTKKKSRYIKLLKKYKNIAFIASGHYHVNGEFEKYRTKHFSTPALFLTPSYIREITIDYDKCEINNIKTRLIEIK